MVCVVTTITISVFNISPILNIQLHSQESCECTYPLKDNNIWYLYFWTVSVSTQHAHIWVVEFQSQNRGHMSTIICPSNVFNALRYIPCLWFIPVTTYRSSSSIPYPLPRPLPPSLSPLIQLGPVPHAPTIYYQPMPPASAQYSHRVPESASSKCTARPSYASSGYKLSSTQTPPPPLLSTSVVTPSPHPPFALADFP